MFNELKKEEGFFRQKAGGLIKCVLAKKMTVQRALLAYPRDVQDKSVRASWHALCHLEADEELRRNNPEYAEEQDSYLENIANILLDGEELPFNITDAYKEYYDAPLMPHKQGWAGFLASFESFLNIKK